METKVDSKRALLRHAVATVAYRGGKVVRGVPPEFRDFRGDDAVRSPGEILAHVGDLFAWASGLAQGRQGWTESVPLPWDDEVARFFRVLAEFDSCLAVDAPLAASEEQLFQGPVADALTHIGQIAILRRIAGIPVRGENYFLAQVEAGRVGSDQATPRREFD